MVRCAVINCGTKSAANGKTNSMFFSFPKNVEIQRIWLRACGWDSAPSSLTDLLSVCSAHFKDSDKVTKMVLDGPTPQQGELLTIREKVCGVKSTAVPTLNMPIRPALYSSANRIGHTDPLSMMPTTGRGQFKSVIKMENIDTSSIRLSAKLIYDDCARLLDLLYDYILTNAEAEKGLPNLGIICSRMISGVHKKKLSKNDEYKSVSQCWRTFLSIKKSVISMQSSLMDMFKKLADLKIDPNDEKLIQGLTLAQSDLMKVENLAIGIVTIHINILGDDTLEMFIKDTIFLHQKAKLIMLVSLDLIEVMKTRFAQTILCVSNVGNNGSSSNESQNEESAEQNNSIVEPSEHQVRLIKLSDQTEYKIKRRRFESPSSSSTSNSPSLSTKPIPENIKLPHLIPTSSIGNKRVVVKKSNGPRIPIPGTDMTLSQSSVESLKKKLDAGGKSFLIRTGEESIRLRADQVKSLIGKLNTFNKSYQKNPLNQLPENGIEPESGPSLLNKLVPYSIKQEPRGIDEDLDGFETSPSSINGIVNSDILHSDESTAIVSVKVEKDVDIND